MLRHWAFFKRELGAFLRIIVDIIWNTMNWYSSLIFKNIFERKKVADVYKSMKLWPNSFNLQNCHHPVSFICAWAMPQAKKGAQKVHSLEKTTVLCQSISKNMAPQANALPLSLARMEEVMMMVYSIRFTEATSSVNTSKPILGMDRRICNMKYFYLQVKTLPVTGKRRRQKLL